MAEPTIRRATPTDAQTLSDLGARTFTETFGHLYPPQDLQAFVRQAYGLRLIRAGLADPRRASWLVEAAGEPVGYALAGPCNLPHAEVTKGCGELKRLYILKAHQNGGTGRALLEQSLEWLEAQGRGRIWIGVWSQNLGAQRLYARLGFAKVGEYDFPVGRVVDREFILRRG